MIDRLRMFLLPMVRIGLIAAGVFCASAALFIAFSDQFALITPTGLTILIAAPVVACAALAVAAVRLPKNRLPTLGVELVLVSITVLSAEFALVLFYPLQIDPIAHRADVARQLGRPFDRRSYTQVIDELTAQGIDAHPYFSLAEVDFNEDFKRHIRQPFYPLSHIANATIVQCNEGGKFMVWQSDEHGFHNPKGLYARAPIQIAALGSSFTLGMCVDSDENMVARIRERFPVTLNFGMAYTSNLTTLGIFREFVEPLRPRVVLWFLFNDDFVARDEPKNEVLKRYFDPRFRQGLIHRQDEVSDFLRRSLPLMSRRYDRRRRAIEQDADLPLWWGHVVQFRQLRGRFDDTLYKKGIFDPPLTLTRDILRLVKRTVEGWGGRLYTVYIPHYVEAVHKREFRNLKFRDVAPMVRSENIPLIDGLSALTRDGDPKSYFPMGIPGHFNPRGHKLIADIIIRRLTTDLGEGFNGS